MCAWLFVWYWLLDVTFDIYFYFYYFQVCPLNVSTEPSLIVLIEPSCGQKSRSETKLRSQTPCIIFTWRIYGGPEAFPLIILSSKCKRTPRVTIHSLAMEIAFSSTLFLLIFWRLISRLLWQNEFCVFNGATERHFKDHRIRFEILFRRSVVPWKEGGKKIFYWRRRSVWRKKYTVPLFASMASLIGKPPTIFGTLIKKGIFPYFLSLFLWRKKVPFLALRLNLPLSTFGMSLLSVDGKFMH